MVNHPHLARNGQLIAMGAQKKTRMAIGGGENGEALSMEELSGESGRIGTGNLDDDDVPFGSHTGFV